MDEINTYNVGLGQLFYYLTLVVSLRIQDILIRRDERREAKALREEKIELEELRKQKFENDMAQALQQRKEEGNEEEEWDEEEEKLRWESLNPPNEIPAEVQDELDLDLEEEEAEA